jgi:hypothetical protein
MLEKSWQVYSSKVRIEPFLLSQVFVRIYYRSELHVRDDDVLTCKASVEIFARNRARSFDLLFESSVELYVLYICI